MAVLVTGGNGFLGSHTCRELGNRNEEVVVADGLLDRVAVERIFREHPIHAVIHFADVRAAK